MKRSSEILRSSVRITRKGKFVVFACVYLVLLQRVGNVEHTFVGATFAYPMVPGLAPFARPDGKLNIEFKINIITDQLNWSFYKYKLKI